MPGSYFQIRAVAQRAQYITTWENCMKCSMFCQVAVHRGLQSLHSVYTLNKKKCIASTALNLVVNILNVERCFLCKLGWDHFQCVIMAALLFSRNICHLMLHVVQLYKHVGFYFYVRGFSAGQCWRWRLEWMNEWITRLLCRLCLTFILCVHVGLCSRAAEDWTHDDCTVTVDLI